MSEDKRQSGWQCQEGKCNREKKSLGGVFFARDCIEKPEDSTRIRTGDRLEQVACQVADLALEMTEDALREASMYLRRCDSDRCATERALRRSRTADSASGTTRLWGGTTKAAKGDRGLAASTKNREEEWAAWWMLSASKSRDGRCSAI